MNTTSVLKTSKPDSSATKNKSGSASSTGNNTTTTSSGKTEEELREEEELQMAIALSKSEAEVNEKQQKRYSNSYQSSVNFESESNKSKHDHHSSNKPQEQLDPNLDLYMNRAYWEQKSKENSSKRQSNEAEPSAPQQTLVKNKQSNEHHSQPHTTNHEQYNKTSMTTLLKSESDEDDIEQFQNNLKSTIEIFVNRMNSNKNRGRPISNDSAVQSMFLNITNMHSQLLKHIQQQDDQRSKFELLQDKLSQAKDARAALDSLREEYNEKLRREAEEAEMIKQQQMAFKLDIMRKKKQEYLQYQRQIALQRVQDQEREMKMRLEQQKYGAWPQPQFNQSPQVAQPFNQPFNQPVYPPNYSQAMNYGDQILPQQYQNGNLPPQQLNQQLNHPNNIPNNIHSTMQQPPQTAPINPPNQHVTMPTSDPSLNYQQQTQYQQDVYNMQALNNSLPPQSTNNGPPIDTTNQQPQYVTQTSVPESNSSTNHLPTVTKQAEEAPLISFD